ncbi:MAG TPA: MFS transporter [Burkholderiales bacterium]|nr:MFS transporter [Burkholderiales bacterium]
MTNQQKALYLVFAQNTIVFTVLNVARIALSLYALHMGAGATEVGLVVALLYVPSLFFSLPAGILADRHGSRWLLVASSAVTAAGMLVPSFLDTVPALCIGSFAVGVSLSVSNVLGQNLVGQLSTPAQRMRNFGNYALVGAVSSFVGPLMVGLVIDHAGFPPACLLAVVMSAIAALLALTWGRWLPGGQPSPPGGVNIFASLQSPAVRRILMLSSVAQIGFDSFNSFMPVYAHGIGLSASAIGVALSAFAVASLAMRAVISRLAKGWPEEAIMAGGFICGALAFFLLPVFKLAAAISVIAFIFGIFGGLTQPIAMMMLYNASEEGRAGEAMGLRITINNFMRVIGPTVFGATARTFGLAPLFLGSGVLMLFAAYRSFGNREAEK